MWDGELGVMNVAGAVTVRLWLDEEGVAVGEVLAPSQAIPHAHMKLTPPLPVPAERAADIAIRTAAARGLELVVADPDGLWPASMEPAVDVSVHAIDRANQLMAFDDEAARTKPAKLRKGRAAKSGLAAAKPSAGEIADDRERRDTAMWGSQDRAEDAPPSFVKLRRKDLD